MRHLLAFLLVLLLASPVLAQEVPEHRIWASRSASWIGLPELLKALGAADVVFVGENHEQPDGHRLELALLQGLHRERAELAVGLEMFERDVQPLLDAYMAGSQGLPELLAGSRPWKRYETDYHPLVDYARENGLPLVGTNAPRSLASQVAKGGLGALEAMPVHVRRLFARSVSAPIDAYYQRFTESPHAAPEVMLRYYEAQCLKDDTMAESVADFLESRPRLFVHFNGSFHSDYGLGTVARLRSRSPRSQILTVSLLPVEDVQKAGAADHSGKADFLIFHHKAPEESPAP